MENTSLGVRKGKTDPWEMGKGKTHPLGVRKGKTHPWEMGKGKTHPLGAGQEKNESPGSGQGKTHLLGARREEQIPWELGKRRTHPLGARRSTPAPAVPALLSLVGASVLIHSWAELGSPRRSWEGICSSGVSGCPAGPGGPGTSGRAVRAARDCWSAEPAGWRGRGRCRGCSIPGAQEKPVCAAACGALGCAGRAGVARFCPGSRRCGFEPQSAPRWAVPGRAPIPGAIWSEGG